MLTTTQPALIRLNVNGAGGIFHTLPFLIPGYGAAISAAIIVVAGEALSAGLGVLAAG
jgi:hypothetical protein